ncbi:MAG: hypothetical protein HQK58_01735 [Deltaproteobacteria bacterium]|nr:hypothetical protein [Deltaproteobacteria bacterium]
MFNSFIKENPDHGSTSGNNLCDYILSKYDSVAAVLKNAEKVFHLSRPMNYMFADATTIAVVEVAPGAKYKIQQFSGVGMLTHTNHYTDKDLIQYCPTPGTSSTKRLARINELMKNSGPFKVDDFETFSQDTKHTDCNDNILRTCTEESQERTILNLVVNISTSGNTAEFNFKHTELHNNSPTWTKLTINDSFWSNPIGLDGKKYSSEFNPPTPCTATVYSNYESYIPVIHLADGSNLWVRLLNSEVKGEYSLIDVGIITNPDSYVQCQPATADQKNMLLHVPEAIFDDNPTSLDFKFNPFLLFSLQTKTL